MASSTAYINALIDAIAALPSGGTVYLPAGEYPLDLSGGSSAIVLKSKVTLKGAGEDLTILKLNPGQNGHVINVTSVTDGAIEDLTVDADGDNQTAGHAIRLEDVDGFSIRRVKILDSYSYSIGCQEGSLKNITFEYLRIYRSGDDGIDWKNKNDDNENIIIRHVLVDGFNLRSGETQKAAIDCRGPINLSYISILNVPTTCMGVRFRQGELGDVNGYGGHNSTLSNFYIESDGLGSTSSAGVISVARNCTVSNGTIKGTGHGVISQETFLTCNYVTVDGALTTGFRAMTPGSPYFGTDYTVNYCAVINTSAPNYITEGLARFVINQCTGASAQIDVGSTNAVILGGGITTVTDNGTGTLQVASTDADLAAALVSAGGTAREYKLSPDGVTNLVCAARYEVSGKTTWIVHEIPVAGSLSTAATAIASMKTFLRAA